MSVSSLEGTPCISVNPDGKDVVFEFQCSTCKKGYSTRVKWNTYADGLARCNQCSALIDANLVNANTVYLMYPVIVEKRLLERDEL
jgi:predicted SprT family Zn-dependent metalloprotease